MMIDFAISQIGEEKAKEVVEMLIGLTSKMNSKTIYILKKIPKKGVCLIGTNTDECPLTFKAGSKPSVTELEKIVREIEFE